MKEQKLILVDENDAELGTMEKMAVHQQGLLHRAFSVFIFDSQGRMLLQRRADNKYHSAGLWSNACCSHPVAGEELSGAVKRRLFEELGIETPVEKIFDFVYRTEFPDGLIEYEFDHVFAGIYDGPVLFNTSEVKAIEQVEMEELQAQATLYPERFTSWFLLALPKINAWLKK